VVTRIPQYLLFRELGWLDTYLPLFVPQFLAWEAFFVFMLIQFMRSIPRDIEEAARVDGANTFQVLIYVVVPMLAPALISVCLFQFMWTMNDFLGPLIYISSIENYPVSLALRLAIDTTEAFNWNEILAMTGAGADALAGRVLPCPEILHQGHLHGRCERLMAELQLRSVEKVYGGGFKAVHGIDLHVAEGEFMCWSAPRAAPSPPRCA
jgi:hypothetical protein